MIPIQRTGHQKVGQAIEKNKVERSEKIAFLLVALGGAIGAMARYAISLIPEFV